MSAPASNVASQVLAHLSSKGLTPTQAWLVTFLSTQRPTTPLPAVKQTALFRILASDLAASLQTTVSNTFPPDILNANIQERRLPGHIPVQVIDIEDICRSCWSQVEAIEAAERGETTKGREIIRVVQGEDGLATDTEATATERGGPHKLLLQDAKGTRVYGFELSAVEGVGMNMSIGAKMLLKNAVVTRGVVMLEPGSATLLGGKVEAAHKAWKEGRKTRLKASVGAVEAEG